MTGRPPRLRLGNQPRSAGQATVELALCLPVVLLLVLLVMQVGLVLARQIAVVHAAREGARAAAVDPRPEVAAAAAARAGADPARCQVQLDGSTTPGATLQVSVRCHEPTDLPLVGSLLGSLSLGATASMRVEG